jgi:chromosome segregation ATPase
MNAKTKVSNLTGAWERLESVCAKLWDENSSSAVEVQAVVEEFKGEVHRVDAHLANTEEMRALDLREHEDDLAAMRRHYEIELAGLKKRLELQDNALREKDMRVEELLKTLARKEEENLNFHSQVLRMSASSDEIKTKKMEEFYQELMKTEATQADSWQKRHLTLEQENEHRQKILAVRQTELDAWENRRMGEEEALKKRATDVELKSQQLVQEYRKKQQEIEDMKAELKRNITDLVRQYQSRLRGADPEPTPHPR